MKPLHGKVVAFDGHYFSVFSPKGPGHLQLLHLVPGQMRGAKVGDTVTLEYQVTTRSGLWNVVAVEETR